MLEAPTERRGDPRALRYIVDHLPPGTTIKRQLLIVNRTDQTRRVDVYPAAATLKDAAFRFGEGRAENELTSWVALDERAVELEPWGETRVRATITVPPTASQGERYGVVWASTASTPRAGGEITQVHRVGVRMYLDIGPGGEPASDFSIGEVRPARSPEGEPSVTVQVSNTGGRAIDLTGAVILSDGPAGSRAGPFPVGQGVALGAGRLRAGHRPAPEHVAERPLEGGGDAGERPGEAEHRQRRSTFPDAGRGSGNGAVSSPGCSPGGSAAAAVVGLLLVVGLAMLARRSRRSVGLGLPPAAPRERTPAGR